VPVANKPAAINTLATASSSQLANFPQGNFKLHTGVLISETDILEKYQFQSSSTTTLHYLRKEDVINLETSIERFHCITVLILVPPGRDG
jgi:hypothetical protein